MKQEHVQDITDSELIKVPEGWRLVPTDECVKIWNKQITSKNHQANIDSPPAESPQDNKYSRLL